jgi:chromosome segregation ATPase
MSYGDDTKMTESLRSQIDSLREQLRISKQIYEEELDKTVKDRERTQAKLVKQVEQLEADWREERSKREQLERELEHFKWTQADEVRRLQGQKSQLTQELADMKEQYFSTVTFQAQLEKTDKERLEARVAETDRAVREPLESKIKDLQLEVRLVSSQNDALKLEAQGYERRVEEEREKGKKVSHKLSHLEGSYAKAKKKLQQYRDKNHSMRRELFEIRESQAAMKLQMMDLEKLVHQRVKLRA